MTGHSPSAPAESRYELRVSGEMDLSTVPAVERDGLNALADPAVLTLVLDLAEVTFIDSTGIGTLVRLRVAAESHDKRLILAAPSDAVLRVLALTSLSDVFTIEPPLSPASAREA